jgi:DNA-binding response OmpR family regulator
MRILIAEDDSISRYLLEATLVKWGYTVVVTADGQQALAALSAPAAPILAVLDWMMPGMDGVDVVRHVRANPTIAPPYLILLTAKGRREDVVVGFEAGADDYIVKPFDRDELRARIQVGVRMIELRQTLADRVSELEAALTRVKHLQGLLPICAYCKKIRNDRNYWQQVEGYISEHSEAQFSHGICPDCYASVVAPELEQLRRERDAGT